MWIKILSHYKLFSAPPPLFNRENGPTNDDYHNPICYLKGHLTPLSTLNTQDYGRVNSRAAVGEFQRCKIESQFRFFFV